VKKTKRYECDCSGRGCESEEEHIAKAYELRYVAAQAFENNDGPTALQLSKTIREMEMQFR
jgi:hypothetical protein